MHEIFEKYPKCFYVFVGENSAKDIDSILETVKVISKFFGRTRPTSVVFMGKFKNSDILKFSTYFSVLNPMVRIIKNIKNSMLKYESNLRKLFVICPIILETDFSAAKAAQERQMSVSQSVCLSVCLS